MNIDLLKLIRLPAVQQAIRNESHAFEENMTRKRMALLDDLKKADSICSRAQEDVAKARQAFEAAQAAMHVERGKLGNLTRTEEEHRRRRTLIEKQLHELGESHVIYGRNRASGMVAHLSGELQRIDSARKPTTAEQAQRMTAYREKLVDDLAVAERVERQMQKLRLAPISPMDLTESVDRLLEEIGINAEENSTFLTT